MADGTIKIDIEVDGKQVAVASKELDRLEESGHKTGKGLKSTESSMDGLSDKSAKAGSSVKGAGDAIDGLGDSGSKASKDLKGADSAIDSLADSSGDAAKSVKGTSDSLDDMSSKAGEAANSAKKVKDETEGVGQQTGKATISIKNLAVSLGLVAIASTAFNTLKSSLDSAIARFDTLNAFPKVLQALGVSAEESEAAMQKLGDGIDGLPTLLNDIAGSAQRMYTSFSDMDKAADTAIALNNALLGSGSSAEQAKRGTEQYIKALQTGKIQMDTWNTLSETMDVGLIKIAEGFGYAGKSAKDDLYKALQNGTVTLDQFNDKLIEVGTGTGIMAQLAKENSLGIATSLGNLKNSAARGVANIIDSFNKLSKEVTGKDIAQNIDSLKVIVNQSFKVIGNVIEGAAPIVKGFASAVQSTIPVVQTLSPAIIGLVTAYGSYTVITKASAAIQASNAVLKVAMSSSKALTIATSAQMAAQVASTTATKSDIAVKAAQTGAVKLSTLTIGLMTGAVSLSTVAQMAATKATAAFSAAIKFLAGPVGWITIALGAVAGAVYTIIKRFNETSAEAKRLNAETEKLGDSSKALSESVDASSDAYKKNQKDIKATAESNKELASRIGELSEKENKSAADKLLLSKYVDQLNEKLEGLNLSYDEQADSLSMSSEQLQARVDLMREEERLAASQERLLEIDKERTETQMQLKEINTLQDEWNQKKEEGTVKVREANKALEELEEQENSLRESMADLAEQQVITEEQIKTSTEAITAAVESGISSQKFAYEDLSEAQQKAVDDMKSTWEDYKDAATDMFDKISTKSELSAEEMRKNLEHNQKVVSDWADNIAKLAERGVDEGLLETLRAAGPESAGHVNALVKASDDELKKLSDAFAKGGDVATEALSKSLGLENSNLLDAVSDLVVGTEKSLRDQIKAADFESIGIAIPDGTAGGVVKGTPKAEEASKKMAKSTADAFKAEAGIQSPSRVFKDFGANITEGLVLGINQGTSKVIQAVQNMFKGVQVDSLNSFNQITRDYDNSVNKIEEILKRLPEIVQDMMKNMLDRLKEGADQQVITMNSLSRGLVEAFKNTPSEFNSIGRSSMSGLNQGLLAGEAQVMATARRIANAIRATMQSALDINSPSGVMRDEVGRWIPEGIALGIEENAKSVYKALDNLSNGMMLSATPEVALGTSRMAYTSGLINPGGGGSVTNTNSRAYNPTFKNYFTRDESTPSEATRKNKQQSQQQAMEWGLV